MLLAAPADGCAHRARATQSACTRIGVRQHASRQTTSARAREACKAVASRSHVLASSARGQLGRHGAAQRWQSAHTDAPNHGKPRQTTATSYVRQLRRHKRQHRGNSYLDRRVDSQDRTDVRQRRPEPAHHDAHSKEASLARIAGQPPLQHGRMHAGARGSAARRTSRCPRRQDHDEGAPSRSWAATMVPRTHTRPLRRIPEQRARATQRAYLVLQHLRGVVNNIVEVGQLLVASGAARVAERQTQVGTVSQLAQAGAVRNRRGANRTGCCEW